MTTTERTQMIINFLPLANSIAAKKKKSLPNFIDIEELKSVAYLGLVDAANKFDVKKSPSFAAYAKIRIFGEIQDYLRNQCRFNNQTCTEHFDLDLLNKRDEENSYEFFEEILKNLDETDKIIVDLYYVQELSLKEIGEKLNLSQSRISQKLTSSKKIMKNQIAA